MNNTDQFPIISVRLYKKKECDVEIMKQLEKLKEENGSTYTHIVKKALVEHFDNLNKSA